MNRRQLLLSAGAASLLSAGNPLAATTSAPVLPALEATLHLGPVHSGAGNHRWAKINGGDVAGSRLAGRVQSGRMDWLACPASGAVEVAITCSVLRLDGVTIQLRDRTVQATADGRAALPGIPTAPVLLDPSGNDSASARLTGRLDAAGFERGLVSLRAFATD